MCQERLGTATLLPTTVIPGAKVAPVAARPALVDKPPALPPGAVRVAFDEERPEITGLWIERVRGVPVVHVRLDNGELLPPRWVTAYCLEPGQEWVEAKGMRYFMRRAEERRVATLEAKPGP